MKIAIVYFSATGNTQKMAEIIRAEFRARGVEADKYPVIREADRGIAAVLSGYEALVFGFPIHSLRAPRLMRDWLATIPGGGRMCGMFFTYGGFMIHPAHYSTAEILRKQGFIPVSSAEFPGKHTYNLGGWRAFPERPDIREEVLAQEYVTATYNRFCGEDEGVLGELDKGKFSEEQLDLFESYRFKVLTKLPSRDGGECSRCGQCEFVCPTGAMDFVSGEADAAKCIACLGCVYVCPEKALHINSMEQAWKAKLDMSNTTEMELNKAVGKLYL